MCTYGIYYWPCKDHLRNYVFHRECLMFSAKRIKALRDRKPAPERCVPLAGTSDIGGIIVIHEKCPRCGIEPPPAHDPDRGPHFLRLVRENQERKHQDFVDVDTDDEGHSSEKTNVSIEPH
ncbi:hypothetical protein MBLNU459_g0205t1 [Dothideomycetes sp. NU459]